MATGDLITQAEYQTATATSADTRVPMAITGASSAIRNYLGRSIGLPIETEARTFDWDGSGVVEIDDVVNVTAVALNAAVLQPTFDYILRPRSAPEAGLPYYWLEMAPARGVNPEMGFEYDLDNPRFGLSTPLTVTVTGDFGWPTVPEAAKMATIWTVQEWLQDPLGGALTAQSIADFSQSYAVGAPTVGRVQSALPERARDALDPLVREAL